jgi:hypothetical protein
MSIFLRPTIWSSLETLHSTSLASLFSLDGVVGAHRIVKGPTIEDKRAM